MCSRSTERSSVVPAAMIAVRLVVPIPKFA
jgi:hypothetical protein